MLSTFQTCQGLLSPVSAQNSPRPKRLWSDSWDIFLSLVDFLLC